MLPISLLISTYSGDRLDLLKLSLESINRLSPMPAEIVIVVDGRITTVHYNLLSNFKIDSNANVKLIESKTNRGLASSLNLGLQYCSFEWVARADADDLNLPNRLGVQWDYLKSKNAEQLSLVA